MNETNEIVLEKWCPGGECERRIARINGNYVEILTQTYSTIEQRYKDNHDIYSIKIKHYTHRDYYHFMLSDIAKIHKAWGKKEEGR